MLLNRVSLSPGKAVAAARKLEMVLVLVLKRALLRQGAQPAAELRASTQVAWVARRSVRTLAGALPKIEEPFTLRKSRWKKTIASFTTTSQID